MATARISHEPLILYSDAVGLHGAQFGEGSLPIVMNNVGCQGRETQLAGCRYSGASSVRSCTHDEDASVRCQPRKFAGISVLQLPKLSNYYVITTLYLDLLLPLQLKQDLLRM